MFVEKYRPKEFDAVIGLDNSLPKLVNEDMPHMLFSGPPGTGKTTTAKIIVSKTGADYLSLNASDERGIETIRQKVKDFAMTRTMKYSFKIVFMDEADYLTKEAQAILRNVMETYANNCRFILTCNYKNKIIDAIQSRCAQFTFKVLDDELIFRNLKPICEKEKVDIEDDALQKLIQKYKEAIDNKIVLSSKN